MVKRHGLHWRTLVEILFISLALILLVLLVIPAFRGAHRESKQTCLSQIRQLAVAVQMYSQDNNSLYPGVKWAQEINPYIGNNSDMFHCPSDTSSGGERNSYGYSGLLLSPDGNGIDENAINAPTEVGVLCDAAPSRKFPDGGIIGGGGLMPASLDVTPVERHDKWINVGYADGRAESDYDADNGNADYASSLSHDNINTFYTAGAYGFIDNPSGGISDFAMGASTPSSITIGGDPCTQSLLRAAAGVWRVRAKANIRLGGFDGQYATQRRGSSFLWGTGDGQPPTTPAVAIARDLVVVIISIDSHIKIGLTSIDRQKVMSCSMVCQAFRTGYLQDALQAYTYDTNSGTRKFFSTHITDNGHPLQFSTKSIIMKDDFDMVNKVGNDPYGIGYCSSSAADPHQVQIIGLRTPDGKVHIFPSADPKFHWIFTATPPADWPMVRTLYACYGGDAWNAAGTGIVNVMLAPGAAGTKAQQAGPLFQASYWQP